MPNALDITGQRFGKLIALKKAPSRNGNTYWLCQCDCGNQKEIQTGNLTRGATKSCGCSQNPSGKIRKKEKYCLNCGKELHKGQYKYCSSLCQQEYQRKEYIKKVNNGEESGLKKSGNTTKISGSIRTYLFKKYDNKCQKCGWGEINPTTGKCPLEIHHKDGNRTHNDLDNLELLCPNCHSLTPNYKYLNSQRFKGKFKDI